MHPTIVTGLAGMAALTMLVVRPTLASEDNVLTLLGRYATGVFDGSAAKIPAYHAESRTLLVAGREIVRRIDLSDPTSPRSLDPIAVPEGLTVNSVAVHGDVVAVALAGDTGTLGGVVFQNPVGKVLGSVPVGYHPDMLVFTPDGKRVVVANEGEPSDGYRIDPEGSISVIDLAAGIAPATVRTVDFGSVTVPDGVRVFGPGASAVRDLEPEYVAVAGDGTRAWATLQENNALALLDLELGTVTAVVPLGFKDHRVHGFDASNRDGAIRIRTWPVRGMYQPDAVAAFDVDGATYLVTANEGDARDYAGFSEETRVGKLDLDPEVFPDAAVLKQEQNLARLKVTNALGDTDQDGDFDALFAFGGRSFSVLDADGALIWNSGELLERIVAREHVSAFNADNDEADSRDSRSDDKGPEPEGLAIGRVHESLLLFVGLERTSGIVVFDVTVPHAPRYRGYVHNRPSPDIAAEEGAGDLGPEGLLIVEAGDSLTGEPLLIVANEVSGTVLVYRINYRGGG